MNVEPIWTVSLLLRSEDAQNRQWEPRGGVGGGLNRQDSGPFRQFCQNQVPFQSNYIYQIQLLQVSVLFVHHTAECIPKQK